MLLFIFIIMLMNPLVALTMTPKLSFQEVSSAIQKQLDSLSLEEKIGQLFMVATVSDTTFILRQAQNERRVSNDTFLKHCPYKTDHAYIKKLIQDYHIGGLIFLGYGEPTTQKKVTENFQKLSKIPLLIGQDCEWGLNMRLDNTIAFPKNMTLGAIQDNHLIYAIGKEIGRQCALLGIHINFAPVVDINTNHNNPIINDRSFGENKKAVAIRAQKFMQGLQSAGILTCAKHFPGHGDTSTDSHVELPILNHSKERLQDIEFYPFKQLINADIPLIMTAHIATPSLEKKENRPATLSKNIITGVLKKKLNFNGLVITDGLGMRGVTKNFAHGNIELEALLAGNDILLCPLDVPKAVTLIKQAIKKNKITEKEIDQKVLKILHAKQWVLQNQKEHVHENNEPLHKKLHTLYAYALKYTAYQKAITLVSHNKTIIPLTHKYIPVHVLLIGTNTTTPFAKELLKYRDIQLHYAPKNCTDQNITKLLQHLKIAHQIIIGLHGMQRFAQENYGLTDTVINLINALAAHKPTILSVFGSPYSLKNFKNTAALICAYEDVPDTHINTAHVILGKIKPEGKLPVSYD